MLQELGDQELDDISPDKGWFIFGVVRHPTARLWSGWQSKFLLREPRFVRNYPEAPWPRSPRCTQDVVDGFQEFVRTLQTDPNQPAFRDRHFRRQSMLLGMGRTPYSRIYRTSELGLLLSDMAEHLRPLGVDTLPEFRRSNETPLTAIPRLFDKVTLERIHEYYASDFEHFDYASALPSVEERAEYTTQELAEISRLVERGERIGDLYEIALGYQRRAIDLERT